MSVQSPAPPSLAWRSSETSNSSFFPLFRCVSQKWIAFPRVSWRDVLAHTIGWGRDDSRGKEIVWETANLLHVMNYAPLCVSSVSQTPTPTKSKTIANRALDRQLVRFPCSLEIAFECVINNSTSFPNDRNERGKSGFSFHVLDRDERRTMGLEFIRKIPLFAYRQANWLVCCSISCNHVHSPSALAAAQPLPPIVCNLDFHFYFSRFFRWNGTKSINLFKLQTKNRF